jgi:ankyrin repeat protein
MYSIFLIDLLVRQASVQTVNTDGDTALSLAQKQGHREIVTILRGYGA